MNRRRFSNFEDRLERLIEGGFARLFRGGIQPREVAVQLIRAIEDNATPDDTGRETAPCRYQVGFHHTDLAPLLARTPNLSTQLAQHVITYCQENSLYLAETPQVILVHDPHVEPASITVTATHMANPHMTTQTMEPIQHPTPPALSPPDAQLIVNGQRSVVLSGEVFNIGRHPDNDLVLDEPRVSRHHVQIRHRHGRFVLYDRQSRAGTVVNGQKINEHILTPGDVMRLGSISILYLEEDEPRFNPNDTQIDMPPPNLPEGNNL
ncbi:MAG: FHA domain-containing protein [Anaerolineae bacterium]|nr:FHA domain-containing protein [Anaerolineae bacterium]